MPLTITPLSDAMAAEAVGVDLRQPLDGETSDALTEALGQYAVLCIRDQALDPEQFVRAATMFGEPVRQVNRYSRFPEFPEIGILTGDGKDADGNRRINGATWHTDHSFTARPPMGTILYAVDIPDKGGETSFCDMRTAYKSLDAETKKRIDGLQVVHAYESSRSLRRMAPRTEEEIDETPDVVHPLVRKNPRTGEQALYMSTTRLERIVDLDREESNALVDELLAHATQPKFLYDHEWRPGDMLIWDNRCTMHHANGNYPIEVTRLMHRIMIEGEVPV
ncbi:MAG: TauD/TfdA family dioxygenase [Rhodospirillaceae bacterium]|jgi:taurine dioxygenase|nr:TauD/TfdA family dioxygenase [Rhodospirillaceae bacterium]